MKVAENIPAGPLPERKPSPPQANANGDSESFGSTLSQVQLPGRKPDPVLPQKRPEAPLLEFTSPLPGRKPDMAATADAGTAPVLPGRKPEVEVATGGAAVVQVVEANAADDVKRASRQVARLAGHSYSSIIAQASQESGLDPSVRSRTSTAAGPFQFLERTWLGLFQRYGAAYGLGDLARQIQVRNGIPSVKDSAARKQILDLRHDVDISAGMAARYLSEGRDRLQRSLGRNVTETESRIAYVMGVAGATKLLRAVEAGDTTPAAELLPAAAKANQPLFFDRSSGRALTATETVGRLTRKMETEQNRLFAAIERAADRPIVLDGTATPMAAFQSV